MGDTHAERLNRLAAVGLTVATVMSGIGWLFSSRGPDASGMTAAFALAAVGVILSSWMMREPDRAVWDASTPLLVAAGAAAGSAAPLLLVVAGRVLAWLGASRQTWRLAAANDGVMAVKWGLVGLSIAGLDGFAGDGRVLPTVAVIAVAAAVGVFVNFPLMAVGVRYLYGQWPSNEGRWKADIPDLAAAVVMGAVATVSPTSSVGLAMLVVLCVTQAGRVGSRWRAHVEAVFLEVQAAIVAAETVGTTPGHTMAVVEIVDRLSLDRDPIERRALIRAAWLHALAYAKDGRVCNGTSLSPELSYATRSIALLGLADRRRLLPRAGVLSHTEDPDAQLVAGACAHVERPERLRATDAIGHLVFTFGITPKIATRITSCPVSVPTESRETLRSIPGG